MRQATAQLPHPASPVQSSNGEPASPPTRLPVLSELQVARAEKAVANLGRVRQIALRVTNKHDWTDIGGRPYLNESGCTKVGAFLGVSLTNMHVQQLNERYGKKEVIRFVAKTTARFIERELEVEGVASSDESFFAKRNGVTLPLSEIDLNAVRKKALTNAHNRAIKKILGLGALSWQDVHAAGVDRRAVASVGFGEPSRNSSPSPQRSSEKSGDRLRLSNMLYDMSVAENLPLEELLRDYTSFTTKEGEKRHAKSIDSMSDAWVAKTVSRVEVDWRSPDGETAAQIDGRKEVAR